MRTMICCGSAADKGAFRTVQCGKFATDERGAAVGQATRLRRQAARAGLGQERVKGHVCVMTLGYSRRAWVEGYERKQMGALLAAHERAFRALRRSPGGLFVRPHTHGGQT